MAGRHWVLTSAALPKGHMILGREPVTIGREPGCAIRLYAMEVSRRHAQITRTNAGYTIQDLGSANGTFVNGRSATKPVKLEHEDLITVGNVSLQFVIVDGEREQIAQRFAPGVESTDHVSSTAVASTALFAGQFTRDTLHQVCQLIEFHEHAGVLRVEAGGCSGYLRFKDGHVVDARFGPATGEKAARTLLASMAGEYAFYGWNPEKPGSQAPGGSLKIQALALVMEVMRSEESQERRLAEDGFLDEHPPRPSDLENLPPDDRENPNAQTQRLPRTKRFHKPT